MDEPAGVPWSGAENPQWRAVVDKWEWKELGGGGWAKDGPCPNCRDGISITKTGDVIFALTVLKTPDLELMEKAEEGPITALDGEAEKFYARCNCGEKHHGRPPTLTTGCGAWAYIDPPPKSSKP